MSIYIGTIFFRIVSRRPYLKLKRGEEIIEINLPKGYANKVISGQDATIIDTDNQRLFFHGHPKIITDIEEKRSRIEKDSPCQTSL